MINFVNLCFVLILGGLLICLAKDVANDFITELKELDGADAWIIGDVVEGERNAKITQDVQIIEV